MAELTPFQYRPGVSVLHRRDVRFKLIAFVAFTLSTLHMTLGPLAIAFLPVLMAVRLTGIRTGHLLRGLRYFLVLLGFVFGARVLSTEGSPLLEAAGLTLTREGITAGAIVCLRLALTVLASLAIVATTRISDIRAAVVWLLKPVPLISETRTATMIGLLVRFLPVILIQAGQVSDAQRARCIEHRKNPLYRLRRFALPLMRRTFITADRLAVAMEARCFSEQRTEPVFASNWGDWLMVAAAFGVYIVMMLR